MKEICDSVLIDSIKEARNIIDRAEKKAMSDEMKIFRVIKKKNINNQYVILNEEEWKVMDSLHNAQLYDVDENADCYTIGICDNKVVYFNIFC